MKLPDITASFCDEFRAAASVHIPVKELGQLLALGGKRTKDSLHYTERLKQQKGWIHFWALLRKGSTKETADFGIGVHTITPPKEGKERKSRGLNALLERLELPTGESEFRFSGTFRFPKDQFKTRVNFPDDAAVALGGPNGPQVRVAGLRLVFATGPVESLIIDGDEQQIYISSTMNFKARITEQLISEAFAQLSQLVNTLIINKEQLRKID